MSETETNKILLGLCDRLTKSSQTTTESTASIKEIAKTLDALAADQNSNAELALKNATVINESLKNSVQQVHISNDNLTTLLKTLVEKVQRLGDLEGLFEKIEASTIRIDQLAAQSKMLALNATIEAARIGDAGRGFAVVATEIKVLSITTEKASAEIKSVVSETASKIRRQVSDGIETANSGFGKIEESFKAIEQLKLISETADPEEAIDSDRPTVQQLIRSFESLTDNSLKVAYASHKLGKETSDLNREVEATSGAISELISVVKEAHITVIEPMEAYLRLSKFEVIDVRREDEYCDDLGHIEGSKLLTFGPDFKEKIRFLNKTKRYLFVCRTGGRSARAANDAEELGFENIFNPNVA